MSPLGVLYDPAGGKNMSEVSPSLAALFPAAGQLPADWAPAPEECGRDLLIDGRVVRFDGPTSRILSAVCVRHNDGRLEQVDLGPAALASAAEGLAAVQAAERAWKGGRGDWARATVEHRISCVEDFVRRAKPLRERVAKVLMWEVAKPWADCLVEFDRTISYIEDTLATLRGMERDNAVLVRASGFTARVRRAPLGVALCMGPYNYAVNEVFTTVIPALVMGNPVVMKTPRFGIMANALLAPALAEAFPPGVVNLVTGDGATVIGPIMASGLVDVLAFIGSSKVAGILQRQHPNPYRLRLVLGMGAKNPGIVLEDADLDQAAAEIVSGALTFSGQRCTAIKHVLVARSREADLVARLKAKVEALPLGMPWEDKVVVTPLPDPGHVSWLAGLVRDAVGKGARVANDGGGEMAGTLFRHALLTGVPPDALLYNVEQFGPIVPVSTFEDPAQVLDVVDRSEVGQQASIFGRDPAVLGNLVDHLTNMVCRVNLNTQCRRGPDVLPFTGRKDSAVGTLSVFDALRTFSIRTLVATGSKDEALLDAMQPHSAFLDVPPLASGGR
jgi:glyceraldehyde-3-phosphate dehydrogenase (NADP+)